MELSQTFATAIAATALVPIAAGIATDAARRIHQPHLPALKGPVATAMVCASLLRTAPTLAVTPPPAERLQAGTVPQPISTDPTTEPTSDHQDHVVEVGDSLWAIACRTLRQRSGTEPSNLAIDTYWRTIYAANQAVVGTDPNLIYPGQRLVLP